MFQDVHVDGQSVRECAKTVLINQLFILFPFLVIICPVFMHYDLRWHLPFPSWYRYFSNSILLIKIDVYLLFCF